MKRVLLLALLLAGCIPDADAPSALAHRACRRMFELGAQGCKVGVTDNTSCEAVVKCLEGPTASVP